MKIEFIAPFLCYSGYGQHSRDILWGLLEHTDHDVSVKPYGRSSGVSFGDKGRVVQSCWARYKEGESYDLSIYFQPPQERQYRIYRKKNNPDRVNAYMVVFECDKIKQEWVDVLNSADVIITLCHWNIEVFRNSGVTVPIIYLKTPFFPDYPPIYNRSNCRISQLSDNDFVFYSIFQWSERKNPLALLRAYYSEFKGVKDCVLLLKTYWKEGGTAKDRHFLNSVFYTFRKNMLISETDCPRVYLYDDVIGEDGIYRLHGAGDCFVLPSRGEGFGLPIFEASALGNSVITTDFGAVRDYLDLSSAYLCDYSMSPIFDMPPESYSDDMNWADINISDLKKGMRYLYENRDKSKRMGENGRKKIINSHSGVRYAQELNETLEKIIKAGQDKLSKMDLVV